MELKIAQNIKCNYEENIIKMYLTSSKIILKFATGKI